MRDTYLDINKYNLSRYFDRGVFAFGFSGYLDQLRIVSVPPRLLARRRLHSGSLRLLAHRQLHSGSLRLLTRLLFHINLNRISTGIFGSRAVSFAHFPELVRFFYENLECCIRVYSFCVGIKLLLSLVLNIFLYWLLTVIQRFSGK